MKSHSPPRFQRHDKVDDDEKYGEQQEHAIPQQNCVGIFCCGERGEGGKERGGQCHTEYNGQLVSSNDRRHTLGCNEYVDDTEIYLLGGNSTVAEDIRGGVHLNRTNNMTESTTQKYVQDDMWV